MLGISLQSEVPEVRYWNVWQGTIEFCQLVLGQVALRRLGDVFTKFVISSEAIEHNFLRNCRNRTEKNTLNILYI